MLKRHEIQVLRRAGHSLPGVAKLAGVSVRSVQRVEAEPAVSHVDNAAERIERAVGRPSVASSERVLRPAQRALLKAGETAVGGVGHAEATGVRAAQATGLRVTEVAASRPICASCAQVIREAGAKIGSAAKEVKP